MGVLPNQNDKPRGHQPAPKEMVPDGPKGTRVNQAVFLRATVNEFGDYRKILEKDPNIMAYGIHDGHDRYLWVYTRDLDNPIYAHAVRKFLESCRLLAGPRLLIKISKVSRC